MIGILGDEIRKRFMKVEEEILLFGDRTGYPLGSHGTLGTNTMWVSTKDHRDELSLAYSLTNRMYQSIGV